MDWKAIYICQVFALALWEADGRSSTTTAAALAMRGKANKHDLARSFHNRQFLPTMECNGEENFLSDLSIISFMLSFVSSTAGLFSLAGLSFPGYFIGIISTVIGMLLWIPGSIFTFFAWGEPFFWLKGNLLNIGSLIVTLFGTIGIVAGTLDLIIGTTDEVMGITSVILSALTTFPEAYDDFKKITQGIFGREATKNFLREYGCG